MDLNNIYLLASALSLIIMAYLAIKEARSKRDNNVSSALKNLADALNLSSTELAEELKESALLRGTVELQQKQINELMKHQGEREGRITALENTNENQGERIAQLESEAAKREQEVYDLRNRSKPPSGSMPASCLP